MSEIRISKKYKPLFDLDGTFHTVIVTGGRNSQKSFAVSLASVNAVNQHGHRVLYSRYTNASLEDSIYAEVIEKIEMLNYFPYFNCKQNRILPVNSKNKGKIVFKGLKAGSNSQTANLKGLKDFSLWILDEAEELTDEDTYNKIAISVRGNKGSDSQPNIKILILNPTSKEHFVYKRYFENAGVKDGFNGIKNNVCYIHATYLDCLEFTPPETIETFNYLKKTNPVKYNHVVLGGWLDKAEGVVFNNWELGEFNPTGLQVSYGQDYGFSIDPTTLIAVAIDKKQKIIYVKEHLYKPKLSTSEIGLINKEVCGNSLIVADSAEPRLISELARYCNIIEAVKGQGSISAGVSLMLDYKIIVEPSSTNIAKELNNYIYADKGSKLFVDNYNHAIDAIRYNVSFQLTQFSTIDIR